MRPALCLSEVETRTLEVDTDTRNNGIVLVDPFAFQSIRTFLQAFVNRYWDRNCESKCRLRVKVSMVRAILTSVTREASTIRCRMAPV